MRSRTGPETNKAQFDVRRAKIDIGDPRRVAAVEARAYQARAHRHRAAAEGGRDERTGGQGLDDGGPGDPSGNRKDPGGHRSRQPRAALARGEGARRRHRQYPAELPEQQRHGPGAGIPGRRPRVGRRADSRPARPVIRARDVAHRRIRPRSAQGRPDRHRARRRRARPCVPGDGLRHFRPGASGFLVRLAPGEELRPEPVNHRRGCPAASGHERCCSYRGGHDPWHVARSHRRDLSVGGPAHRVSPRRHAFRGGPGGDRPARPRAGGGQGCAQRRRSRRARRSGGRPPAGQQ